MKINRLVTVAILTILTSCASQSNREPNQVGVDFGGKNAGKPINEIVEESISQSMTDSYFMSLYKELVTQFKIAKNETSDIQKINAIDKHLNEISEDLQKFKSSFTKNRTAFYKSYPIYKKTQNPTLENASLEMYVDQMISNCESIYELSLESFSTKGSIDVKKDIINIFEKLLGKPEQKVETIFAERFKKSYSSAVSKVIDGCK